MGKRARKTRWRTLEIDSDSEESTTVAPHASKGFQRRPFYATKHAFSSQSTPTRRLGFGANGYDAKSTRSSSTASDTKLTFNEDEYTKITTPRQDVLFKKGYLNKPKTYQTQTSTGNSTASTGNSTGNGTPDHQSADGTECTDVEYESQFVFPNAFVDHNGIYYINSFEPYPLVVYNPQLCYPEYNGVSRSKRLSTGSLTESTSPNNEEVSQDLSQSGGETSSLYNAGTYQTYGQDNSTISDEPVQNGSMPTEPRKIKKRRRRRISKAAEDKSSSSEDYDSSEEPVSQIENNQLVVQPETEERLQQQQTNEKQEEEREEQEQEEEETKTLKETNAQKPEAEEETNRDEAKPIEETETKADREEEEEKEKSSSTKFNLNAEEFVPRAMRTEPLHLNPNLQFVNVHPNFVPLPFVNHPLSEIGAQGFPPGTFLPPGIPLGFLPHSPQPNFINFVPNQFYAKPFEATVPSEKTEIEGDEKPQKTSDEKEVKIEEEKQPQQQQPQPQQQQQQQTVVVQKNQFKNDVDIAKIVSKLEEAAKEQRQNENGLMKRGFRNQKFHPKSQRRTGFYSDQRGGYEKRKFEKRRTNYYQSHHQENEDETAKGGQKETKPKEEIIPPSSSSSSSTPKKFPYHRNVKETQSIPPAPSASSTHQLNYSEMLKKSSQGKNLHGNQKAEKLSEKIQSPAKAKSEPKESKICPKSPNNQWISVSNRKKRKSKTNNDEETEVLLEEEKEEVTQTEIEEVLILTKEEEEMIKGDVQRIEEQKETETVEPVQKEANKDIIELIRESTPVKTILHQNEEEVTIKDVQEIEKEMLKESIESIEAQKKDCVGSNKKKGKKIVSKRVLVKDGDFVASQEEANSVKDVVEEKPKPIVEEVKETEVVEKKKPKKKKKPTKPTPTAINNNSNSNANHSSQSSSSATLNSEETYDFLIDSATIVEDKTNEEVSEEFDKIIQRGLFGGLEEKIKSLNGAVDEEFFRSINFNAQAKQTPEKGFIKAGDLSTILKQQAKKPVENWETSKDCASLDLSSEEKARSKGKEGKGKSKSKGEDKVMISNDEVVSNGERKCDFLDSKVEECVAGILNEIVDGIPEVEEIKIDEVDEEEEEEEEEKVLSNTASMSIEEIDQIFHDLKNDLPTENVNSDVNTPKICTKTYEKFETQEEETSQKSITEAVVEWLKKTKERTPEVEILKSPDTINREFHRSIDDDDEEEEEENADVEEADEIFETNSNDKIEVGEDVLKAFDGDGNFLEIREEFEKRTKRGDLPYRAICCSLM